MIFVKRDPALIPEKVLLVAERAQKELEKLAPSDRMGFIKKKAHVWRGFAKYLSKMSYGKCWYSETADPQSFFDVDHYRPKAEAQRSDKDTDDGYPWLAFSWENFRYSSQRSNRLSTDEDSDQTVGKGSWFPLIADTPKACWDNRCEKTERPVLIDPVNKDDVRLVTIGADGRLIPSFVCIGTNKSRVQRSAELYGLNLPNLVGARFKVMRDVLDAHTNLVEAITIGNAHDVVADNLSASANRHLAKLRELTAPSSPYSLAARCQLTLLGAAELCARPEDI